MTESYLPKKRNSKIIQEVRHVSFFTLFRYIWTQNNCLDIYKNNKFNKLLDFNTKVNINDMNTNDLNNDNINNTDDKIQNFVNELNEENSNNFYVDNDNSLSNENNDN